MNIAIPQLTIKACSFDGGDCDEINVSGNVQDLIGDGYCLHFPEEFSFPGMGICRNLGNFPEFAEISRERLTYYIKIKNLPFFRENAFH